MKKLILYSLFISICLEISGSQGLPPTYQSVMRQRHQADRQKWGNIMLATTFAAVGCCAVGAASFATRGSLTEAYEPFPSAAQWLQMACGMGILSLYARRMAITS